MECPQSQETRIESQARRADRLRLQPRGVEIFKSTWFVDEDAEAAEAEQQEADRDELILSIRSLIGFRPPHIR